MPYVLLPLLAVTAALRDSTAALSGAPPTSGHGGGRGGGEASLENDALVFAEFDRGGGCAAAVGCSAGSCSCRDLRRSPPMAAVNERRGMVDRVDMSRLVQTVCILK